MIAETGLEDDGIDGLSQFDPACRRRVREFPLPNVPSPEPGLTFAEAMAACGLTFSVIGLSKSERIHVVIIESEGASGTAPAELYLTFSTKMLEAGEGSYLHAEARVAQVLGMQATALRNFAEQGPFRLTFDMSDQGSDDTLSMDRPLAGRGLFYPDIYIMLAARSPRRAAPSFQVFSDAFRSKRPLLFWRGGTTGSFSSSIETLLDNPRVRACRLIKSLGGISDCRISRLAQFAGFSQDEGIAALRALNIYGPEVSDSTFGEHQMYLDLPGNTAAWGTCTKYLMGCLVLRPDQDRCVAYTHRLEPWQHFVPVRGDFDDLEVRLDWVMTYPEKAALIAWEGQKAIVDFIARIPTSTLNVFAAGNELK